MSSSKKRTSTRVKGTLTTYEPYGGFSTTHSNRGPSQIREARESLSIRRDAIIQNSTSIERQAFDDIPLTGGTWEMDNTPLSSHGTWEDEDTPEGQEKAASELTEAVYKTYHHYIGRRRLDYRTRRDRVERRNTSWAAIYPALVDAYLAWDYEGPPAASNGAKCHPPILIVEAFTRRDVAVPINDGESFNVSLARHGYIGNAPVRPSLAISIKTLELFRTISSRTPQLHIQGFVRSLCDMHRVAYRGTLRSHFSIAYDTYLDIIAEVNRRLNVELGRDEPDWRLRNACPPCTYVLEDEPPLKFSMLVAMDGNSSLKRVERGVRDADNTGKTVVSENTELPDGRTWVNDMYLSAAEVDRFKDEVKRRLPRADAERAEVEALAAAGEGGRPIDGIEDPTPCVERWSNLADEATKKMWGIFRETGIFVAVCRHGTMLVLCDMIKSGELAKYALAVTNRLIDVFGPGLLDGYDIGCGFSTTANNSALLGPKLRAERCQFCVGSFHGHAHCRLCQLDWHPLYINGAGLEDFESCERCFASSNGVALGTRHASTFHRHQAIMRHFTRWNADKYAEISRFLYNNYIQALNNLDMLSGPLNAAKLALKIPSNETFEAWRRDEKAYLLSLRQEPETDTLRMEYLRTLKKLREAQKAWEVASQQWRVTPVSQLERPDFYAREEAQTRNLETARVRGLDALLTLQKTAEDLETKLEIVYRWTPDSEEWKTNEKMATMREYQLALDKLEGLVVARLFELTKLNHSGTGYKLRTHIAKALKARSQAIRTAVTNYNDAALRLSPPRLTLDIKTVLEYVFIAQFDILRDSRHHVQEQPWTQAAEREASSAYFKLLRSREEIARVNVEVRRLATWIQDEERDLNNHLLRLRSEAPRLAHQLAKFRELRLAINKVHRQRISQIEALDGFSGQRGTGIRKGSMAVEAQQPPSTANESIEDSDESDEDGANAAIDVTYQVVGLDED